MPYADNIDKRQKGCRLSHPLIEHTIKGLGGGVNLACVEIIGECP